MSKFVSDECKIVIPDCKDCKYAIEDGIEGCEKDLQTMKIKIGMEKCNMKEKKDTD